VPVEGEGEGFHEAERADPLRLVLGETKAERPAPVVQHQGDVAELERADEFVQKVIMGQKAVVEIRFVAFAEADHIQRHATVVGGQRLDHVAPQVAAGGVAVQEQQGRALALVDVMKAVTVDGQVARSEGVIGESHAMRPGGFSGKMPRPR